MAEKQFEESVYRFSDPIRLFKANDPYYFEIDNIPLRQLQENCLWLKDQVRKSSVKYTGVKRADIEELRPYATGGDRLIRVKPGRFSARVNDASTKDPLAFLQKVIGEALGENDAWLAATHNEGSFPTGTSPSWNSVLEAALEKFKSTVAEDALGMVGLSERAFTWPVVNADTPVGNDGVDMEDGQNFLQYADNVSNNPGLGAISSPTLVSKAITWAKSENDSADSFALPSFEYTNQANGFAKLPRTESYFIKRWRGVSRIAIVDVEDEITVQVPAFDATDFNYIDENGNEQPVDGVQSRIDLVFIYSKPVDVSSTTILKSSGKTTLTKPALGIVRGAGIKANYSSKTNFQDGHISDTGDDHKILASPADQFNEQIGFTSTSANDISFDVRGSFPAPDDILNIAPLISEKLESEAFELVGQSILPVAYVWVQNSGSELTNGSVPVADTDVIDIRPLFRTAELSYNERTGITAAFPQLSLANPAVGKAQLDREIQQVIDYVNAQASDPVTGGEGTKVLATGYVFGGWNFGPEGALYDYYSTKFGADDADANPDGIFDEDVATIRAYIASKYGLGSAAATFNIPAYPDWDLAQWCVLGDITDKGLYPNDYVNTFISGRSVASNDPSIVAGSFRQKVNLDGTTDGGGTPARLRDFRNTQQGDNVVSKVNFHYIAKKIKFDRSLVPWLADYTVDCNFVNCVPQSSRGSVAGFNNATWDRHAGSYYGWWVEKGFDEFTIYVAFVAPDNNHYGGSTQPRFPAPHSVTTTSGGKKSSTTSTTSLSDRGGERFSSFIVPVGEILSSDTTPVSTAPGGGYTGNPRVGKCTYPTVMFTITGVAASDSAYLYGNLNGTNPVITLKPN